MANPTPVGAAAKPSTKLIPQHMVNEYCRITAEINMLTGQREQLRDQILELFNNGHTCPTDGPWLVVRTLQERCTASWKDICMAVIDTLGVRAKAAALKLVTQMQSTKSTVAQVTTKVNPQYEPIAIDKYGERC